MDSTRRHPRVPFRTRVHCTGRGVYFSDLASNLSEGGIGLQTVSRLEPGDEIELEFRLPGYEQGFCVRTRVVWVQPVEHGGKVRCGLAFSEIADDERREIQRYIQQNLG